jgi:hypothetical protein
VAGDWLKWSKGLADRREILVMATKLDISPAEIVVGCFRVWEWADDETEDGNVDGVTLVTVDRFARIDGFADAMVSVGWLRETGSGIEFVNYDHHNSQTAKRRALTSRRVASHRAARNAESVTPSVTSALPEKRREEKSLRGRTDNDAPKVNGTADAADPSDPILATFSRWKGAALSITEVGEIRTRFDEFDEDLVVAAVENAIDSKASYGTRSSASAYVASIVAAAIREGRSPGEVRTAKDVRSKDAVERLDRLDAGRDRSIEERKEREEAAARKAKDDAEKAAEMISSLSAAKKKAREFVEVEAYKPLAKPRGTDPRKWSKAAKFAFLDWIGKEAKI